MHTGCICDMASLVSCNSVLWWLIPDLHTRGPVGTDQAPLVIRCSQTFTPTRFLYMLDCSAPLESNDWMLHEMKHQHILIKFCPALRNCNLRGKGKCEGLKQTVQHNDVCWSRIHCMIQHLNLSPYLNKLIEPL